MNTIKIMVCDDDDPVREMLRHNIEKLCRQRSVPCEVRCCGQGEDVLGSLAVEQEEEAWEPDLLFLDIQMPGRNGMEIAAELRRRRKETILIFVTALSEYVYEAFDVGALHYLVKPFGEDKLGEVLDRALQQYERQREVAALRQAEADRERRGQAIDDDTGVDGCPAAPAVILVKRGGISTRVRLADIIYAEVFNRKVLLHTTGGEIEYYGRLTDLSEQAGGDFYRTHRAYLVHFKYVVKYNADTIWLEQGTAPVSKKQFAGFVRQYMRYIGRQKER